MYTNAHSGLTKYLLLLGIYTLLLVPIMKIGMTRFWSPPHSHDEPKPAYNFLSSTVSHNESDATIYPLSRQISQYFEKEVAPGSSLYIEELETGHTFGINQEDKHPAMSLI